ncbi:Translation initiation factor IF-2 [Streptomyces hirsutus]
MFSICSGEVKRNTKARLIRDGKVIAENLNIVGLRRFKDDVTEIREGFEGGINLGNFNDIKVDDVIADLRDAREAAGITPHGVCRPAGTAVPAGRLVCPGTGTGSGTGRETGWTGSGKLPGRAHGAYISVDRHASSMYVSDVPAHHGRRGRRSRTGG